MRRVLMALAILAVAALPSFATDAAPDKTAPSGRMRQHPEMMQEMMRNPEHLLMMAYQKNLMTFGHILEKVARQGDTVPPDVARTAVAEMRRSVDEIEKHRPMALRDMPAEMQHGEMQKMMDQHLVDVKTHLRQLEDLSRSDRIPSQEVLKNLEAIFAGCQKMPCGAMHGRGLGCAGKSGEQGRGGCGCDHAGREPGPGGCADHPMAKGAGHAGIQEMVQKMKRQDAELTSQVKKMQQAPRDRKVDLMAGIVAQLVQQRVELTSHMEKMQQHHMMPPHSGMHQGCAGRAAVPPPPPGAQMFRSGEGPDEEGDLDDDEVETGDVVGY